MDNPTLLEQDVKRKRNLPGINFMMGFFLGLLLSMFVIEMMMFSAYYQPNEFGSTYKEIFCTGLK